MDDIQDRTADIVNGRAARRAAEKSQKRASDYAMSRANLSGVTNPGGSTLFDYGSGTKSAESAQLRRMAEYRKSDWRDAYLPGRDVDNVMGIDIETTGTDPARVYIIDVGFEYMNMISLALLPHLLDTNTSRVITKRAMRMVSRVCRSAFLPRTRRSVIR